MKLMLAKDAWKEMVGRDPIVRLLTSTLKVIEPPSGKCRCDVCGRTIDDYEMVYQDEKKPITVCSQCYEPEQDYHNLRVENRIHVKTIIGENRPED